MANLTAAWPFGYEDFAAPASEWTATYWAPPELAFNAADAGGPPPHNATVALTQAAATIAASGKEMFVASAALIQAPATIAASGKETFVGVVAMTQAPAVISASGKETFVGAVAMTQSVASISASGKETFTAAVAMVQPVASIAASGKQTFVAAVTLSQAPATIAAAATNVAPGNTGIVAMTQTRADIAAAATVVNPSPPPPPSPTARILPPWKPRVIRNIRPRPRTGRVSMSQPVAVIQAVGDVHITRVVDVALVQAAPFMRAIAEVVASDDELALLLVAVLEDELTTV